jgi:peptide/nickel transport system permease protein
MKRYLIKRLLFLIPTFVFITFIIYGMARIAPGEYTKAGMGPEGMIKQGTATKEILEQERKLYGLDKNPVIGWAHWFCNCLHLDFGNSRVDGRPVIERIKEALPISLLLIIISIFLQYIISIPLGIYSAAKRNSMFDRATSIVLFILYSLPEFWIGMLLILFFASGDFFNIFPFGGIISDWAENMPWYMRLGNVLWHIVLPVTTMTYGSFAFLSRFVRGNMIEVINKQYITTALAKGISEKKVIFVHAFRNSLVPLVTIIAGILPALIGGDVIVEKIFSIPGIGYLAFESINSRDIPVIMAILSFSTLLTLVGMLIADILYGLVDPRIRIER